MLFVLTGQVQTGKTRWLRNLVLCLNTVDFTSYGLLTPGIWRRTDTSFEKLGIEAVLLPQSQTIPFAQRVDLVLPEEQISKKSRALGLHWRIYEEALRQINDHFCALEKESFDAGAATEPRKKGLLLVDELGRLELEGEPGGLTAALNLLDRGPSTLYEHALIVVRSSLYAQAEARFSESWRGVQALYPTEAATNALLSVLGARA